MYTEFFGFTDKPFNVTPDPKYLYLSPSHQEALASMIYGIRERRGFVSIIGEVGTGKTTLLHTLFNELDKDIATVFIFNTRINFNQLLHNILIELELTPKSNNKSELLHQLNDHLIKKLSLGENVALIIDEAQNLPSTVLEELRMLSNLETAREKLLQIILVGQPELDTKLRSPHLRQLKQRIGINCYLTPLNHEERKKYILHRLTIAASKDDNIFSEEAIKLICKHSRGIPRIINILCDNALLSAYGKEMKKIDTDIVEEIISDYERSTIPVNEKDESLHPVQEGKKSLSTPGRKNVVNSLAWFTKSRLAVSSFISAILVLLILGVLAYSVKPDSLNQFINSLFADLSNSWQKDERSIEKATVKNKTNNPQEPSVSTIKKMNAQDLDVNAPPKAIVADKPIIEKLPPSKQIPSSLGNEPTPFDPISMKKSYKTVLAKEGDIVSSLVLKEYGILSDTICDIVKRANPEIEDLDQISIGQKIILPNLDIDNMIVEVGKGVFSVHIASFSSYDDAKQYFKKSAMEKLPISISPVKITGRKLWYRVTVGNFSSRAQAIEFAKNNKLGKFPYKY
jgi:type II secretory pathway predicted ATPase ExeA/phage tail protein X